MIFLTLLLVFVAMQFIRPARNKSNEVQEADLIKHFNVPTKAAAILKTSCYDCHSNHTRYPWYAEFQPFGWWLAHHIKEGKAELNFSSFGTYSRRKKS